MAVFCMLYGASNGVLAIVCATIPLAVFGKQHYGAISGAMAGPALAAKAAGPLLAAWALGLHPSGIWRIGGLLMIALASFGLFLKATTGSGAALTPDETLQPTQTGPMKR